MKLGFLCCHVDPVDGTYLVCCYIRTFTCQLKIKFFFTNKKRCSVIVWKFTSSRFCEKLCCCNLLVPKSFSLVGMLLMTWAFHPNSSSGGKSFNKLSIESWRVRETLSNVSRAFFFKTRPPLFPWHSISRLEQMKHDLLVIFITTRVTSSIAAIYQMYLNEMKQRNVTALYIFS